MTTAAAPTSTPPLSLLVDDVLSTPIRCDRLIHADAPRRGAVTSWDGRWLRRADLTDGGPVVFAAASDPGGTQLQIWGSATLRQEDRDALWATGRAWLGLEDDLSPFAEICAASPLIGRLAAQIGEIRLSRMPRVGEALGRATIEQLVQGTEARRSIAQLVARTGELVTAGLWRWPTARELGSTPVWDLRRCGVSGRMATALHAGAVEDTRLERVRGDWAALDRRLTALPGVGPWTSAEARLRLGDPDAVSVGDYHLPTTVGYALSGPDGDGADGTWTDAGMLSLLAPYAGQRGRVIRLVEMASARGLVARRARRGPRAALSAHRYW